MRLEYDEFHDTYILVFTDKDKCHFCKYSSKCPLIRAVDKAEFVISRYVDIPTWEFCELYSPNERLKKMENNLNKKNKYKER